MNSHAATRQWIEKIVGLRPAAMGACIIVVLCGLPKTALAITLMEAFHEVLVNDSLYAMARASRDAGLEKLPLGRGALLPNVTLSANKAWNDLSNKSDNFNTRYRSDGYTVQLTQPLLNWPAWEGYKQGELLAAMSEVQLVADTQDLMVRLAQAYFDVLAATDVLDAQEALKTASLEQLDLTKSSLEAGTVPITDVNEAQSRFDLSSAQVLAASNDLEVKRYALGRLTGSDPNTLAGLRKRIALVAPQPQNMKNWADAAESENPAVKAKQLGFEYATREVSRNAGAHLPSLDLVIERQGGRTVNTFNGAPNNTDQNSIMLQLTLPLYSGGRTNAREREAVALKEKARADLQDTTRAAVQAARQNYLGVMSGLAQLKGLESAGISSASALDSIKAGYESGIRANVDVLNAQAQVADTRQRLARARVETLMSLLRLKAAAGQLREHDLSEVDALLDK
jgi:outer membrane protein